MKKFIFVLLSLYGLTFNGISQTIEEVQYVGVDEWLDLAVKHTPTYDTKNWVIEVAFGQKPFSVEIPSSVSGGDQYNYEMNGNSVIIKPLDETKVYPAGVQIKITILGRNLNQATNQPFPNTYTISSTSFPNANTTSGGTNTDSSASTIWKHNSNGSITLVDQYKFAPVGIGTDNPKERLQLGNQVFFHDGGDKMFTRNCYYDPAVNGDRRIVDGYVSCFRFSGDGGFNFTVTGYDIAGTQPNGSISALRIKDDGKVGINNTAPRGVLEVGDQTNQSNNDPKVVSTYLNGLTTITANVGGGNDVLRLQKPELTPSGRNHYMFFSNRQFTDNVVFSAIGAYDALPNSNGTSSQEGPKAMILQPQSIGGNLGIGYHATAPTTRLSVMGDASFRDKVEVGTVSDQNVLSTSLQVNGLTNITANYGGGNDAFRANFPDLLPNGRNHYMFIANRFFESSSYKTQMYSSIGAYEVLPNSNGTQTDEGPRPIILQPQAWGGNLGIGYHTAPPTAKLSVKGDGYFTQKVAIGIAVDQIPTDYLLGVNGGIIAKRIKVAIPGTSEWSDYVFAPEYNLRSLTEVETYIKENKHLPGIPSAEEIVADGYDMAKMDAKLLEKIEELTLYMIDIKKENEALKAQVQQLKK